MLSSLSQHLEKHWRSWLIASFCIASTIAFSWIALASEIFQECIRQPYYNAAYREPKEGFALIFGDLGRTEGCVGEFLVKDGEAITAFFTLVLSISTIALWWSTRRLWRVTESMADSGLRQGNAAIAAQSPRLIFSGLKLVRYLDKVGWVEQGDRIDGSPYGFLRPLVCISNVGLPVMSVNQFCINWIITKEPPLTPSYTKIITAAQHLDNKVSLWLIDRASDCFELTDAEITGIQNGDAFFWMYGWVSFVNHLTNEIVTHGFIGRYDPHAAAFFLQGPAAYTFEKRAPVGA